MLGPRALNRALLDRQMLLRRASISVDDALERQVGMQAQAPNPPYLGLWTRLDGFRPEDLAQRIRDRRAVRMALMRSTIFLVTARDALRLRPVLDAELARWGFSVHGRELGGADSAELAAAGRALAEQAPRTFQELGVLLGERWPDAERAALGNMVRNLVPLVQVPPRGVWGESGPAAHTPLDTWLGRPLEAETAPDEMVMRYFAAFGPATVRDAQHWCGLKRLNAVVDRLRPRLRAFRDASGAELFDLPDAPRPDEDTPAPPRFLPEFDNVLLSHADRTRIISEPDRKRVFTINGIIRATILVDGMVRGMWKMARDGDTAALVISPFAPLAPADRAALEEEGMRLARFAAENAVRWDVRFENP
ncbi:winged helix DNA-binding domain-containing protein [Longimicrobium sp.]|uniref:winged helix DNA-binding domain-containing protein n=1 Tax=Longimicrobium sp. TaxID=2029185 RepID=UPI002E30328C|nr:winged helix DNA-binding domain-containing protein [Longimicrobium sp.]HEX6038982.1 winged helix DNA-binding domain-containing protein [Longimicrobium sp.]